MKSSNRICLFCQSQGVKCRCSQCKEVFFCNRECQIQAWPEHRTICLQTIAQKEKDKILEQQKLEEEKEKEKERLTELVLEHEFKKAQENNSEWISTTQPSSNSKSKKKKSKNKQKQKIKKKSTELEEISNQVNSSNSNLNTPSSTILNSPSTISNNLQYHKTSKLQWGTIDVREYTRFPGGGGSNVPCEGSWALGLGTSNQIIRQYHLGTIDSFEERRQIELKSRFQSLSKRLQRDFLSSQPSFILNDTNIQGRSRKMSIDHEIEQIDWFETRQLDYRPSGIKNPLFQRLSERERKEIWSSEFDSQYAEKHMLDDHHLPKTRSQRRNRRNRCSSSGSETEVSLKRSSSQKQLTSRSSSDLDEMYNTYSDLSFHEIISLNMKQSAEYEQIRESRDCVGCTCGQNRSKIGKLSAKKLRSLLHDHLSLFNSIKMNVEDDIQLTDSMIQTLNKAELQKYGHLLADELATCQTESCECLQNGISCHQDACEGCSGCCKNPLPMYKYQRDVIQSHRSDQLRRYDGTSAIPNTI